MLKDQNDVGLDLDDGIFQVRRKEEVEVETDRQLPKTLFLSGRRF